VAVTRIDTDEDALDRAMAPSAARAGEHRSAPAVELIISATAAHHFLEPAVAGPLRLLQRHPSRL